MSIKSTLFKSCIGTSGTKKGPLETNWLDKGDDKLLTNEKLISVVWSHRGKLISDGFLFLSVPTYE